MNRPDELRDLADAVVGVSLDSLSWEERNALCDDIRLALVGDVDPLEARDQLLAAIARLEAIAERIRQL